MDKFISPLDGKEIDTSCLMAKKPFPTSENLAQRVKELESQLAATKAALDQHERKAPLCEAHGSGSGTRSGCPYCHIAHLSLAFSKIDYMTGPPNEMEVSLYDVECCEESVVERVKSQLAVKDAENARLKEALAKALAFGLETAQHCPCGARPESLDTHPHVVSCPVDKLIATLKKALSPSVQQGLEEGGECVDAG